jgi:hypothetical protein
MMFGIPIEKVLREYAGSLPLSDEAIYNVLIHLDECRELPEIMRPKASRYSLRVINAILPELDIAGADTTAIVCGLGSVAENGQAYTVVNATGEYTGECTPQNIRSFLIDITMGTHPEISAKKHQISQSDFLHLEYLLELEDYWHDNIMDRVLMVYRGFGKWWKVARELQTYKPWIIWSWVREAKVINKVINQAIKESQK